MGRTRRVLQGYAFWIFLAYVGLVGVVVALYFHQTEIGRAEAARQAAARARVAQCVQSIPELQHINRFISGVQQLHEVIAENSRQTLMSTPKTDPQYRVRLANYRRVAATVEAVSQVKFPIPTVAECVALGHT
jgi:hypothetical protein